MDGNGLMMMMRRIGVGCDYIKNPEKSSIKYKKYIIYSIIIICMIIIIWRTNVFFIETCTFFILINVALILNLLHTSTFSISL